MTIASDVKQCLASLKGAEAGLLALELRVSKENTRQTINEAVLLIHDVVEDLQKRVIFLEREESTYKEV